MVQANWLLNDKPFDDVEEFVMEVLDYLLLGTPSFVLRKTLMESGLGSSITGGGFSSELIQDTYSIGLKEVDPSNLEQVEKLLFYTLEQIAKYGFINDAIASLMNILEL